TAALGIYAYRVGKGHSTEVAQVASGADDTRIEALERQISDVGHEREVLRGQLAQRDKVIVELRRQTEADWKALNGMKSAQASLESTLQTNDAEKQQVANERASLAQKYEAAQASLQNMQS